MRLKKVNLFFAEIETEDIETYLKTVRKVLSFSERKENFLEINDRKYYCRIKTDNNFDLIKFYKLRDDFNPLVLKDNGEDKELELDEGCFAEVAYFLIYKRYIAILRTGYSPSVIYFRRYLQKLFKEKNDKECPQILTSYIMELYDKEVVEKINKYLMTKFELRLKVLDFNSEVDDEIDDYFKTPLERAIQDHVMYMTFGMKKQKGEGGFTSNIKNSLIKLRPFASCAKVSLNENGDNKDYNLLQHRINYQMNITNSVHVEYEKLLREAMNWFLKE